MIQNVDVCMFTNGKFKNTVALMSSKDDCPIGPGCSLTKSYTLLPLKYQTENWIALEDNWECQNNKPTNNLACTVVCQSRGTEERGVFAIYVSYHVKVRQIFFLNKIFNKLLQVENNCQLSFIICTFETSICKERERVARKLF